MPHLLVNLGLGLRLRLSHPLLRGEGRLRSLLRDLLLSLLLLRERLGRYGRSRLGLRLLDLLLLGLRLLERLFLLTGLRLLDLLLLKSGLRRL